MVEHICMSVQWELANLVEGKFNVKSKEPSNLSHTTQYLISRRPLKWTLKQELISHGIKNKDPKIWKSIWIYWLLSVWETKLCAKHLPLHVANYIYKVQLVFLVVIKRCLSTMKRLRITFQRIFFLSLNLTNIHGNSRTKV